MTPDPPDPDPVAHGRVAGGAGRAPYVLIAALGLAVFLGLHLLFVAAWAGFFGRQPWPGYEESARLGLIEPWFVHSPRSLWLTRFVFFAVASAVALARRRARWAAAAALWIGASIGVAATWAATTTRTMEWGWLGCVLYPFRLFLPILLGTALAELARRTILPLRPA